jgi:tRNA G37 N-methylase Trm5
MVEPSDEKSNPFTQFYAQLLHQGNMLQDLTRTGTYRHAFLSNSIDFQDKVVLDVGTGTGILAIFAIQAGARKVYAVEASESAIMARILVKANGYSDKIEVIQAKLEDVALPELVDIIISEPIGFLLGERELLLTLDQLEPPSLSMADSISPLSSTMQTKSHNSARRRVQSIKTVDKICLIFEDMRISLFVNLRT